MYPLALEERIFLRFDMLSPDQIAIDSELRTISNAVALLPDTDERMTEAHDLDDEYWPDITKLEEAVSVKFAKQKAGTGLIKKFRDKLDQSISGLSVTGITTTKPRKNGIFIFVTTQFQLSDGQTITAYFHAPDAETTSLNPNELLVSYKFTINKLDVTGALIRGTGKDLPASKMAMILGKLVSENKDIFASKKAAREERAAELSSVQTELSGIEKKSDTLMGELILFEANDKALSEEEESLKNEVSQKEAVLRDLQGQIETLGKNKKPEAQETDQGGKDESGDMGLSDEKFIEIKEMDTKKVVDLSDKQFNSLYESLEGENQHDEAFIFRAKRTGKSELVDEANALKKLQDEAGEITPEIAKSREELSGKINAILSPQGEAEPSVDKEGTLTLDGVFLGDGWAKDTKSKVPGFIKEVNGDKYKLNTKDDPQYVLVKNRKNVAKFVASGEPEKTKERVDQIIQGEEEQKARVESHRDQVQQATRKGLELTVGAMAKLGWKGGSEIQFVLKDFGNKQIKAVFGAGPSTTSILENKLVEQAIEFRGASIIGKAGLPESKSSVAGEKLSLDIPGSSFFRSANYSVENGTMANADDLAKVVDDAVKLAVGEPEQAGQVGVDEGDKATTPPVSEEGKESNKAIETANAILGGTYDENPAELEAKFESIIDELEGVNPELLEQVSNYYTDILVNLA